MDVSNSLKYGCRDRHLHRDLFIGRTDQDCNCALHGPMSEADQARRLHTSEPPSRFRFGPRKALVLLATIGLTLNVVAAPAFAHRNGCHRWHSCPSDTGAYVCGDTGHYNYCGYGPGAPSTPRPAPPTIRPVPTATAAPMRTPRSATLMPRVPPSLGPTTAIGLTEGWHSRWLSQSDYLALTPGEVASYWIRFVNIGTETWSRGTWGRQVNLALSGDNREPFRLGMAHRWLWEDRLATTVGDRVRPGEVAEFRFDVRAPITPGKYSLHLRPVVDGLTWLEDEGVFWIIEVAGQPTASSPAIAAAVAGSVTDLVTGAPLSGVCVSVALPTSCSALTDLQGRYAVVAESPVGQLVDLWFRSIGYRTEVAAFNAQVSTTKNQQLARTGTPLVDPALAAEVRDMIDLCNDASASSGLLQSASPMEVCAAGDYLDQWRGIVDDARRRKLVTVSSLQTIDYVGDVFSTNDGGLVQVTIETWFVQTREQGYVSAPEVEVVPQVYVLRRVSGRLLITENYQWRQ